MHLIQRILSVGAAFGALAFMVSAASAQTPSTLEVVKKRGQLICGVNVGLGGFSLPDSQGKWSGLDIDMCNAVAAAVFGDATKAKYVPLSAQQRFLADVFRGGYDGRTVRWQFESESGATYDFAKNVPME